MNYYTCFFKKAFDTMKLEIFYYRNSVSFAYVSVYTKPVTI